MGIYKISENRNKGGLGKFDGTNWFFYTPDNSGLPSHDIYDIAIDGEGVVWIANGKGGLVKFERENWTVYNWKNSGLPEYNCETITFDLPGNLWIGTTRGLAVYRKGGVLLPRNK